MKARLNTPPYTKVTWRVYNTPDLTGAQSGYDPSTLIDIAIDYTINNNQAIENGAVPVFTSPGGPAGGDLGGTYPNPDVLKIHGFAVSSISPTNQYVLTWNSTTNQWEPSGATGGPPSGIAGGGLTGTYPNPTVASIAGLAAGGDLGGTYPNPDVLKVHGVSFPAINPATFTVATIIGANTAGWGFIFDHNIDVAAGISGSKISPNFGTQTLTSGPVFLGTTTGFNSLIGGVKFTTRSISSDDTLDAFTTDMIVYADTSGGAIILTLPTPSNGRVIIIKDKKQSFATHNLRVDPVGGIAKIDGVSGSLILSINNSEIILTSDGTDWFTQGSIGSTGTAGGDLSGTYPNPTVAKVDGVSYPASPSTNTVPVVTGANTVAYQQIANTQISNTAAIAYSKLNLTGDIVNADISSSAALDVSKLATGTAAQLLLNNSTPTPTWTTMSGDATISSSGSITNVGIRTKTLSSSLASIGSLQDGYILTWVNGDNAWEAKPQVANVTWANDLATSTNTSQNVVSITGASGFVPISSSGNIIKWAAATTAPGITQTDASSGAGASMAITAQKGNGSNNGGSLNLAGGAGGGSGGSLSGNVSINGNIIAIDGADYAMLRGNSTTGIKVGTASPLILFTNVTPYGFATGLVKGTVTGTDLQLSSSTLVNADISSSAAIAVSKLAAGTAGQILLNNSGPTPTWTTMGTDGTISSAGALNIVGLTGSSSTVSVHATNLTWDSSVANIFVKQASTSGAGNIFHVYAQDSTANSGGILKLKAGDGSGAFAGGDLTIESGVGGSSGDGGNIAIFAGGSSGSGANGYVLLGSGSNQLKLDATNGVTISNLGTGIVHSNSSGVLTSSLISVGSDITAGTAGQLLLNSSTPTPTWTSMSGDATIDSTGAVTLVALRGKTLDTALASVGVTQDGYALTWVNADNKWEAKPGGSGGSGVTTIGTFDSQTSAANGLVISGVNLYAQSATASNPGMIKLAGDIGGTGTAPKIKTMQATTTATKTANYTITTSDFQIFANPSGAFNLTLPAPVNGMVYHIWDISGTMQTNNVTLVRNGSEKISGVAASRVLSTNWGHWMVVSDGVDWYLG